jgi:hypothetical protein
MITRTSRCIVYLMVGESASLPNRWTYPTSTVSYVNALMEANADTATFGGLLGGKLFLGHSRSKGPYQPTTAVCLAFLMTSM